jgi:hypothetical protein
MSGMTERAEPKKLRDIAREVLAKVLAGRGAELQAEADQVAEEAQAELDQVSAATDADLQDVLAKLRAEGMDLGASDQVAGDGQPVNHEERGG